MQRSPYKLRKYHFVDCFSRYTTSYPRGVDIKCPNLPITKFCALKAQMAMYLDVK